jgi:hypothetical protein
MGSIRRISGAISWWTALLLAAAYTAAADDPSAGESASPAVAVEEDARDPRALEVARRMADALAGASALRMTVELSYDAVQDDGQSIEFGATRQIAIRRPDRARVDAVDRAGARRHLLFDGRQIVLADEARNVYAISPFEGQLDGMLDHLQDELGVPTPLAELLATNLFELLSRSDSADWVDEQTVGGVACDHVTFRNEETGLQLWVPREGEPLPRRIVITYERAEGRPQFRADLRDWDRAPVLDDALFAFTPAEGAELIQFRKGALLPPGAAGSPGQEEGR